MSESEGVFLPCVVRPLATCVGAAVVCLSFVVMPASAQDKRDVAAARALFAQGVEAADATDWATAADRFERSLQLHSSAVVSYNLAVAWMELGRLVEASEMLEGLLKAPDTKAELRQHAQAQLDRVTPRIAKLTVRFSAQPGDDLKLDTRTLPHAVLGVPTPVDPGERTLIVRRDGEVRFEKTLTLADGAEQSVAVQLDEASAVVAVAAVPDPAAVAWAAPGADRASIESNTRVDEGDERGRPVWKSPWLWTGLGAAVVAIVVISVVAASGSDTVEPAHVGSLGPGTLEVPP